VCTVITDAERHIEIDRTVDLDLFLRIEVTIEVYRDRMSRDLTEIARREL
jgi:hypothetical protein